MAVGEGDSRLAAPSATGRDGEDGPPPPGRLIRIVDVFVQRIALAANNARGIASTRLSGDEDLGR
jgi:hypothetical protein